MKPQTPNGAGEVVDNEIVNHVRNVKLLQAVYSGKKFFVECYPTDEGAKHFPNSNFAVKEIELPDFKLYEEEKFGYKWVPASLNQNESAQAEERACPCKYLDEPCHPMCTCVFGGSSLGCLYCATYGSIEQRKEKAKKLKECIDKGRQAPSPQTSGAVWELIKAAQLSAKDVRHEGILISYNSYHNLIQHLKQKPPLESPSLNKGESSGDKEGSASPVNLQEQKDHFTDEIARQLMERIDQDMRIIAKKDQEIERLKGLLLKTYEETVNNIDTSAAVRATWIQNFKTQNNL